MTPGALPRRGPAVREVELPLPPIATGLEPGWWDMPLVRRGRPLKRWRYVGVFGPQLMLCAGDARIGPVRQRWWAVVESGGRLLERTSLGSAGLRMEGSGVAVDSGGVRIDLTVREGEGCEPVETVSPNGRSGYVWTRKQAGATARGTVTLPSGVHELGAEAVVDETAGYHERRTAWCWSAGVGRASAGERIGWNVVTGVNDDPTASERTLWVDGKPVELGPVAFAKDLSAVWFADGGDLRFTTWAAREHRTNLLLLRSSYRQPFGTFAGTLPGGLELVEGYGVMEWHDVRW